MDVTLTLGQMLGVSMAFLAIVGLVGPGMYKLGGLGQKVDTHDKRINNLDRKFEKLIDQLLEK